MPAGFRLRAVPVLRDNFVYLLEREGKAILIDAGAAEPVLALVRGEGLRVLGVAGGVGGVGAEPGGDGAGGVVVGDFV